MPRPVVSPPPRIGITTYGRDGRGWFELPGEYVDAVRRAGGVALLLPPGEPEVERWLEVVDGLVLAGGGDLDARRYGGRPVQSYMVDAERDDTELALARRISKGKIPALCVCRGLQVLNVALGGTLIEHLPDEVGAGVLHRRPPREPVRHPVALAEGSRLARVLGATTCEVASWHHQAVRAPAPGLEVVARAADGVVEAVELSGHEDLLAVQWHPELTAGEDPIQQRLFDWLVERARARRRRISCD